MLKVRAFIKVMVLLFVTALCPSGLHGQFTSTMLGSDPVQQYRAVETTMQSFYGRGLLEATKLDYRGSYDLTNCLINASDFMGKVSEAEYSPNRWGLYNLVDLAETTVIWRNDFRRLGIPVAVSEPLVSYYEHLSLSHPGPLSGREDDAPKMQIAASLNRYRQSSRFPLPRFIAEGGCGGGPDGIGVRFELRPSDGQLYLIPVFLYKLCAAQSLNPANPTSCDRWTEVLNGTTPKVLGDYIYMARWADGAVRCGPLGFTSEDQDGKTFAITKARSPNCNPGW